MPYFHLLDTTPPNVICPDDIFVTTEPNLHYAILNISLPKADGKIKANIFTLTYLFLVL